MCIRDSPKWEYFDRTDNSLGHRDIQNIGNRVRLWRKERGLRWTCLLYTSHCLLNDTVWGMYFFRFHTRPNVLTLRLWWKSKHPSSISSHGMPEIKSASFACISWGGNHHDLLNWSNPSVVVLLLKMNFHLSSCNQHKNLPSLHLRVLVFHQPPVVSQFLWTNMVQWKYCMSLLVFCKFWLVHQHHATVWAIN